MQVRTAMVTIQQKGLSYSLRSAFTGGSASAWIVLGGTLALYTFLYLIMSADRDLSSHFKWCISLNGIHRNDRCCILSFTFFYAPSWTLSVLTSSCVSFIIQCSRRSLRMHLWETKQTCNVIWVWQILLELQRQSCLLWANDRCSGEGFNLIESRAFVCKNVFCLACPYAFE